MLRRLGIRAKVLAVLAVPMLVVLLAGAFISWESVRSLQTAQNDRRVVAAVTSFDTLNDALNDERLVSQTGGTTTDLATVRQKSDTAVAGFESAVGAVDFGPYSKAAGNDLAAARQALGDDLAKLRTAVDSGQGRGVSAGYETLIDDQVTLFERVAQELDNRELATYVSATNAVARTVDSLVEEAVDGRLLLVSGSPSQVQGQSYTTVANQTEVYRAAARSAVASLAVSGVLLPSDDPSTSFTRARGLIGTGSATAMSELTTQQYLDAVASQRASLTRVSGQVVAAADTVAAKAITAAEQRTALTVGLVVLAAVASFLLALVVSRTIVVPLRRLTAAATDLREELPRLVEQVQVPGEGPQMSAPQIPVTSRDEVGRLAGAFNAVNQTTFQVAQEQAALRGSIAEMFVNVARRDQVLLNRQLSFIDSLERTEEDPQALANLFRLDHLATRMRRNAESLLVLAGIDSGRRLRDSLPLSDVVRTASSEIEQYDRVELDLQADPHMLGFNALPAAHLLAELLENATVFSEPETPVVVTTVVAGQFVEVRIVDQGLGMSDAELQAANEKIVSTSASDALGAQRLGLFVVGRLAQRLGAEVVLRKNANGPTGTETVVRFPATLFQSTEASPLGAYGDTATAVPELPEVTEFDLAALTDGVTEQGLPRRRSADAGALPARGAARAAFDEDAIVLPEVEASALPTDLPPVGADWMPLVVPGGAASEGPGLPSRQPAAAAGVSGVVGAERPAQPADPAARAGLFAGFRGRSDYAATPAQEEAPAPEQPAEPAFVVPGLAPDEEWTPEPATDAWTVTEEAAGQPVGDTDATPGWTSWASGTAPSWAEQSGEGYVPAAFAPEVGGTEAPLFMPQGSEPEPAAAGTAEDSASAATAEPVESEAGEPAVERWTPPEVDLAQWSVPVEEPPAFEPQPDAFSGLSAWNAPQADAAVEETPYAPFERTLDEARAWATGAIPVVPAPEGFPGADATPVAPPATVEPVGPDEPVEAPAWAQWNGGDEPWNTGIPQLEPDGGAPALVPDPVVLDEATAMIPPVPAEDEVPAGPAEVVAQPVVAQPVAPEPVEAVAEASTGAPEAAVAPAWAPTAANESFSELVHGDEVAETPKRRRGWFGRRKEHEAATAPAVPAPPVVPEPVAAPPAPAPAPALPVRSSAWAPTAGTAVPEPFPGPQPPAAPAVPAPAAEAPVAPVAAPAPVAPQPVPAATTSWAPQSSWNPPAPASLPEASNGRTVPSWAPPEWAPRPAPSVEPEPAPVSSSSPGAAEPTAAPRIGTLDDEVAAMLALRSDIQEQALSELSQLSAYRPQVVPAADRLTRRVPTAVPEAPEIVESSTERDPNEVRSRLASFQSGTARGRRDAGTDEETS